MAESIATMSATHACVAGTVLMCDIAFVIATVVLDRMHHEDAPSGGSPDTTSVIGWLGAAGAIFIFGCYGILIKTPSVVAAQVDAMVFQVYYSLGVSAMSLLIWIFAGRSDGFSCSWLGVVFAALWIGSQVLSFKAIQTVGYAVGPAIWAGLTIIVSFLWGGFAFKSKVLSVPGSTLAILLLVSGIFLAAASGSDLPKKLAARWFGRWALTSAAPENRATDPDAKSQHEPFVHSAPDNQSASSNLACMPGEATTAEQQSAVRTIQSAQSGSPQMAVGFVCAMGCGLLNGSIMVPMTTFQKGSSWLGVSGYDGHGLAPIAFLPSLAIGILVMQPVFFLLYYARLLAGRRLPKFHVSVAALPGLLTGCFWGMGNFSAMFATTYLGETIGFPLTQTCLIINGLWGILYYKEIVDHGAIVLFAVAALVIITGAYLLGKFG